MKLRKPKIHEVEMEKDAILMVQVEDWNVTFISAGPQTRAVTEKVWKSAIKRGVII